ncbi:hypothetical protein ACGF3K_21535 [Streptomyces sp. NPDC047980]|uniref:hypothetical protein n=1 Tax=Streptomyces sp. NPDC047980 TaxID=3365494 RepID=UPI00370FF8DA
MTASDQETPADAPAPAVAPVDASAPAVAPVDASAPAVAPVDVSAPAVAPVDVSAPAVAPVDASAPAGAPVDADPDAPEPEGMTPRQARTLRIAAASVVLVALGAVLAVRLASRTSVLVVGVYGLAMILCGIVIELSRHGRTRLGTYLLGAGLAAALAADWLLLP